MGWLALLGSVLGIGASLWNSSNNRSAQKQENSLNRDWSAQEAERNRNFQAKQAEIAYERQQEYFDQNLSIGAQVNQMKEAGLNPALLSGGASPASAPAPSAPSGSTVSASSAGLPAQVFDFAQMAMGLEEMKTRIEGMREDNRLKRAQAVGQEISNLTSGELNQATIANLWSKTAEQDENRNLLIQKVLTESLTQEQVRANISLLTQKALSESKSREVASVQIGLISAQVGKIEFDKIVGRELADSEISLNNERIEEIRANVSYIGEKISTESNNREFFNKVKHYRENIEKVRSDNASVSEKLHALEPIIGKMQFPHSFDGATDIKSNVYDKAYRNYLDTYLDIMIDVAESK